MGCSVDLEFCGAQFNFKVVGGGSLKRRDGIPMKLSDFIEHITILAVRTI